jgi:uncharacterized membrane protein YcaP (DUF421 family)
MSAIEVIGRVVAAFVVLLIMTRIMGKQQISQLTFFHYMTGITIGTNAASITMDKSIELDVGFISLIAWSLLTVFVSYITLKSKKARIIMNGHPTLVMRDGQILESALAAVRLNKDDLNMMLRERDIFNIQDVAFGILESNGELSVVKKGTKQTMHLEDLKGV